MRTITKTFTLAFSFFAISASIMMMLATVITAKVLESTILLLYAGIIITGIGSMACNLWESRKYEE